MNLKRIKGIDGASSYQAMGGTIERDTKASKLFFEARSLESTVSYKPAAKSHQPA